MAKPPLFEARWLKVTSGLIAILYPLLVYLGLQHLSARLLALLLIAVAGLRLLSLGPQLKNTVALALVGAAAALMTLLSGSELGLLFYPVLINATLLVTFLWSWLYPPTVIEGIARLKEPDLSETGIAYIRKLTLVWVAFFAVNGSLAALSITQGREVWAFYNGFLAYLLMAGLFIGERVLRRRLQGEPHA
jgi:uncharacterized membrane protein